MPDMPEPGLTSVNAPGSLPTRRDQTFLAFDFGTRRVGVASGNTVTHTSQPLLTIASTGDSRPMEAQVKIFW